MARAGTYNIKAIATRIAKSAKFRRATLKNAEKKYAIEKKKLLEDWMNKLKELEDSGSSLNRFIDKQTGKTITKLVDSLQIIERIIEDKDFLNIILKKGNPKKIDLFFFT